MRLRIATFNIQNKYKVDKYSGIDKYGDHVKELCDFIKEYNIDIIGLQEVTRRFKHRLVKKLKDYSVTGKYRFTSLARFIPKLDKYNEGNNILSKLCIISTKTKYLPFFPRIPRIMTISDIKIKNKKVRIINTHLDQKSKNIREKQLQCIAKSLNKNIQTIIMGDFNSTVDDDELKNFIIEMNKIGYKKVDIEERTHKIRDKAIDQIFIPKKWNVKNIEVVKLNNKLSDHKPIVLDVEV